MHTHRQHFQCSHDWRAHLQLTTNIYSDIILFVKFQQKSSSTYVIVFFFLLNHRGRARKDGFELVTACSNLLLLLKKKTCVRWKEEGGTIPLLENRFELILRGLIRAGSSHTMSPAAKIKTRSGQIYVMPTIGQVGQSENGCGYGQKKIMNKRKHRKDCKCCPGHYYTQFHDSCFAIFR